MLGLVVTGVQPAHKTLPHRHQHQYSQVVSPHRGAVIPSHLDAGRIGRDPFGAPSQDIEVLGLVLVSGVMYGLMCSVLWKNGSWLDDNHVLAHDQIIY